jgi:hypothetical protein
MAGEHPHRRPPAGPARVAEEEALAPADRGKQSPCRRNSRRTRRQADRVAQGEDGEEGDRRRTEGRPPPPHRGTARSRRGGGERVRVRIEGQTVDME